MTDQYPPFRLDQGEIEPHGGPPPAPRLDARDAQSPEAAPRDGTVAGSSQAWQQTAPWTAGRVVGVIVGAVLVCTSIAVMSAGGAALFADRQLRDGSGYLMSPDQTYSTSRTALMTDTVRLDPGGVFGAAWPDRILGTVRVVVTPADPNSSVFVGVAQTRQAGMYMSQVPHMMMGTRDQQDPVGDHGVAGMPRDQSFWSDSTEGVGTQTLSWDPSQGNWRVVIMNSGGEPGLQVAVRVGATAPALGAIGTVVAIIGVFLLIAGVVLIYLTAHRRRPLPPAAEHAATPMTSSP